MHLDPLTLMVPGIIATAFAGLMLLGAWFRYRDTPALVWWGAAKCGNALGLTALTVGFVSQVPAWYSAAMGLSAIAPALLWAGVLSFHGRTIPLALLAAGPLVWVAATVVAHLPGGRELPIYVAFACWVVYLLAAAWALSRGQDEYIPARWPLIAFLVAHAVIFVGAIYDVVSGSMSLSAPPPVDSWFGMIHFETILFSMATAVCMISMARSRVEHRYRIAAQTDPLTGAANRGEFFTRAHRLFERSRRQDQPFSLIMFDLDHFKRINDTYGHQAGDRILLDFAATVKAALRPNDLFGRYGGEEFAVVLPGASVETAHAIAERVRRVFSESHEYFEGNQVRATVSAGVATAGAVSTLEEIIDAADKAMYSAKHSGRNRVERAPLPEAASGSGMVRIA